MSGPLDEITGLMDAHVDESRVRGDDFDEVRDHNPTRRRKERRSRTQSDQAVNPVCICVFQPLEQSWREEE